MIPFLIINRWIENATSRHLTEHIKQFWLARDILEGKFRVPSEMKEKCINFIEEYVRESDEKNTVLEALKERAI